MSHFRSPIDNRPFLALCKWGLPLEMWRARIDVEVVGDGIERFRQMRDRRAVIVCNHADEYDPEVTFVLSKIVGEDFNFIAARECFDWWHGATGLCFQNIGCYSVVRGEADRESFAMTRDILRNGRRKLVMHPEGEVTRQPDVILPLRKGATRLFLDAQQALAENENVVPLFVVPISIRWRFKDDVMPKLHAAMRKIEQQLRLVPSSFHLVDRIEYASAMMATVLEQEYSAKVRADLPFERRMVELREHVLRLIAVSLSIELPEQETHLDWLRRVNNAIAQFVNADVTSLSKFQQRLHKELTVKAKRLYRDSGRIQRLIGISDTSDWKPLTPERLALRVNKLEREVFGKSSSKGMRIASIGVAEPISLLEHLPQYLEQHDIAVDTVTNLMSSAMQATIDQLDVMQQRDYAASLPK